ncbi:conserved hypothetical protein [Anaeromyxobacter sp. K]|uniref:hypothetical protein n=1 Tax=Anaeromyxobacter sp. (strain K) TaxID=447217 RepID=UPI00015F8824|nr:hypothetical protein [Anaeromyxobacter sp. K]ACG75195.1 conserved hypothetical protein [Anaeromyxobacter sp. K]
MATRKKARATRKASRRAKVPTRGLHPVFGPIPDPGPEALAGGIAGLRGPWAGGWHFGPVADPGPGFGSWRDSLFGRIDRGALDAAALKQMADLRVRRIRAAARAMQEQLELTEEEFKLLARFPDKLQIDPARLPPHLDPGDPPPELRPIDFLRFVRDHRVAALKQTIEYLNASAVAIEAAR